MIVAGIDLSLTSTGLARIDTDDFVVTTGLVTSKAPGKKLDQHLPTRFDRQSQIAADIIDFVSGADFVVIESLFVSKQAGSVIDRAGLWWRIVGALLMRGVAVAEVTATQAKVFLTGAGGADKGTMVRCAGRLWPTWEPSTPKSSEDEADALALASVGLALNDPERIELTEYRKKVLDKLTVRENQWSAVLC